MTVADHGGVRMFKAYMYKTLRSPLTLIGIFGVFALCCTHFFSDILFSNDMVTHISFFLDVDAYRKAIALFAALPFTANFAAEWQSGVTRYCVIRDGSKKYAISNGLFCVGTSFLTVFIGIMLFAGVFSFWITFYKPDPNPKGLPFGVLLDNGLPWLYLMIKVFIFSCSVSMWCVMGMFFSAFFPNKYVALCSPLVASYVIERITINFPDAANLWYLSLSVLNWTDPWLSFLYITGVFTALSAALVTAFYFVLIKKVQNETT